MGSTRDRAPDLTRTPTGGRSPLPTRPRLRPIASPESQGSTLRRREPSGSGGAASAPSPRSFSTPPSGRQPKRDLAQNHGRMELPYVLARNTPPPLREFHQWGLIWTQCQMQSLMRKAAKHSWAAGECACG